MFAPVVGDAVVGDAVVGDAVVGDAAVGDNVKGVVEKAWAPPTRAPSSMERRGIVANSKGPASVLAHASRDR